MGRKRERSARDVVTPRFGTPILSPSWDVPRSPAGARVLVEVGMERGLGRDACLAGTGLVAEELQDPDMQIEAGQELQVARNLVQLLGDPPGLGVDAGRRLTLGSMGIWGFALLSSPTWEDAGRVALRYVRLTPAYLRPELRFERGELVAVLHDDDIPADVRDLLAERDLGSALVHLRAFIGPEPPLRIETRLSGARAAALAALLPAARLATGTPCHVVAIDPALLARPLPHADRQTWLACERDCAALLERRRLGTGMAARVRSRILAEPGVTPSMEQVAAELHVDVRTLHRKLAAEETAFRALVDEVHQAVATDLLSTAGFSVEEVAQRLGYGSARSFARAFRRWTGESPTGCRAR